MRRDTRTAAPSTSPRLGWRGWRAWREGGDAAGGSDVQTEV
ncbi:MAG TPA: hypothetical protein PLQ13_00835 [Candidatus Krumholzibacteria bacterium]|nr:hypothetical protein [Candidatus Krumholzibacteria bacterium]